MIESIEIILRVTCFAKYTYTQNAPTPSSQFSFLISELTWNEFTLQNGWNHLITMSAGNCQNCVHPPPSWEFGCLDVGPALIWWRPWGELWEASLGAFPHFSWEQDVSSGSHLVLFLSHAAGVLAHTYLPDTDLQGWFSGLVSDLSWNYRLVWQSLDCVTTVTRPVLLSSFRCSLERGHCPPCLGVVLSFRLALWGSPPHAAPWHW